MICPPRRTPTGHQRCESVNCCCRHQGSGVRPLTQAERQDYMLGLPLPIVIPEEAETR